MTNQSCANCKFALLIDFGYSNYTVEGTDFHCMKFQHPEAPFDNWYGEASHHAYGENCSHYGSGEPTEIDVDRELSRDWEEPLSKGYTSDPETKEALDFWEKHDELLKELTGKT